MSIYIQAVYRLMFCRICTESLCFLASSFRWVVGWPWKWAKPKQLSPCLGSVRSTHRNDLVSDNEPSEILHFDPQKASQTKLKDFSQFDFHNFLHFDFHSSSTKPCTIVHLGTLRHWLGTTHLSAPGKTMEATYRHWMTLFEVKLSTRWDGHWV